MRFLPFILKRATRNWRLLLVLSIGVVLSTALLSSAPVLVDAVIEFGLPRRLKIADPIEANLRVQTFAKSGEEDFQDIDDTIQAILQDRFAGHLDQIVFSIGTHWMHPWLGENLLNDQRINFSRFDHIEDNVTLVAGEWPGPADLLGNSDPLTIPVVIGVEMADLYELEPGRSLPLSFSSSTSEPDLFLEISGIIRATNAADPYWLGVYSPLKSQGNKRYVEQFSVMPNAGSYLELSAALFPQSRSELVWHVLLDPDTIQTDDMGRLVNTVLELPDAFPGDVAFETGLPELLIGFSAQTTGLQTPIYLLTAEIVLLALFYVIMTAGLAVRAIEREFAVLRSRGASRGQILRIQFVEAGLIVLVAFFSGPYLGQKMVAALGLVGPLADLADSTLLTSNEGAWTAAFVGALASIVGLMIPVGPALRRSIVTQSQAVIRTQKPLWQRLYLDVALLGLGLVLLFRIQLYGGISTGGRVDWLLLLSPLTLLVGSATLVIRLTPPILNALSRIVATGRSLPSTLAFWQTARNPNQFTGLVILLTLASALGILATGLNATLDVNEFERARYAAGADLRFVGDSALKVSDFLRAPGVMDAVGIYRTDAAVDLQTYRSFPIIDLLAIEPISFARVTRYRDDFSEVPMGQLLGNLLVEDAVPGLTLPGEPGEIGLWVWSELEPPLARRYDGISDRDRVGFFAKIATAVGETFLIPLQDSNSNPGGVEVQEEGFTPWSFFSAPVPERSPQDYPLTLHSIWFRNRAQLNGTFVSGVFANIAIDGISVTDRSTGKSTIVEGFEDPVQVINHDLVAPADNQFSIYSYDRDQPFEGEARAAIFFSFSRILEYQGLALGIADRDALPIPALVSPRFIDATNVSDGDLFNVFVGESTLTFRATGVVNYFPTLYEEGSAGYMITSSEALLTRLGNETPRTFNFNEVLLATALGADTNPIAQASSSEIVKTWDLDALRTVMKADPMALGLRSVTFMGYLLTTLLSIIGFVTHFYLSVRQREVSFGILRAMGLSPRQLYVSLAVEQVLVILTGLGLGTLLGVVLNDMVLPGLPLILGEQAAVPPFIPRSDWTAVWQVFGTLGVSFAVSFAVATLFLWRGKVHVALRIGQE